MQIVKRIKVEVSANQAIERNLHNMGLKLELLERIRTGIDVINMNDNLKLMDKTNNRMYSAIRQLDIDLAGQYSNIQPFASSSGRSFFANQFQKFMDARLDGTNDGINTSLRKNILLFKQNIEAAEQTLKSLRGKGDIRGTELANYNALIKKWNYYKGIPDGEWEIHLSWSWSCNTLTKRGDGNEFCQPLPISSIGGSTGFPSEIPSTMDTARPMPIQGPGSSKALINELPAKAPMAFGIMPSIPTKQIPSPTPRPTSSSFITVTTR